MKFKNLKSQYKTAHIITHNDLDGFGAGDILINTLSLLGFEKDDIKVTVTDYSNPLPFDIDDELVLIGDISISNSENAKKLIEFNSRPNTFVVWIDHHKSSLDLYKFYPELKDIYGIRDTNACGAMLCWIFYQIIESYSFTLLPPYEGLDFDLINSELNNLHIDIIMDSDNPGDPGIIPGSLEKSTSLMLLLTDDWDRFILKYQNSIYLTTAFDFYPKFDKEIKNTFLNSLYIQSSDEICMNLVDAGKKIYYWKKIISLTNLKEEGFIASLPVEGASDIEMLCLNTVNKGSKAYGNCFGVSDSDTRRYNYVCSFGTKGNTTSVSIYCADPIDIPEDKKKIGKIYCAADICKKYGGGGHLGAAGFVLKDKPLTFCNIKPLPKVIISQIDKEIDECYEIIKGMI